MNWNNLKEQLIPAKDWILENQSKSGAIFWDEKGKCDPWDHCECLIALAIYEEWEAFDLGINWFFNNLDQNGFIPAEFKKEKVYLVTLKVIMLLMLQYLCFNPN